MVSREVPIDGESTIKRGLKRLEEAGAFLRAADPARIERALCHAARMLADPTTPLGRQAREALPERAQLSPAMIDWALRSTLETVTESAVSEARESLARFVGPHRTVPARLHAVVLSSNLPTAGIKPIVWSLLCRAPIALKLSRADEGLSELFALAITLADEEVGQSILCAHFSRSDESHTRMLLAHADAVSVYGSDVTVAALRNEARLDAEFIPHGHGLGAVFVGRDTSDSQIATLPERLALDVAAYDGRGCLSPHVVFVEEEGPLAARDLSRRLEERLSHLASSLPRAPLTPAESAREAQWRRVSEALGELFQGRDCAVAFDGQGPVRGCPLARNMAVHSVQSRDQLAARLAPYGTHLKCLAVEGAALELPPPLCPRQTKPGRMQKPTLCDLHDGRLPFQGLFRLR